MVFVRSPSCDGPVSDFGRTRRYTIGRRRCGVAAVRPGKTDDGPSLGDARQSGPTARSDRPLAGALYVLGAAAAFAVMGALVKRVGPELPNSGVVFFRNFLALVLLAPYLVRSAKALKTTHFSRHLVRSLAGLAAIYLFFYTLGRLPLAWTWQPPSPRAFGLLWGVALAAVLGQILLTRGYSLAPAGRVGPFSYANVVFSALLGWLFWSEGFNLWSGVGMISAGLRRTVGPAGTRRTRVPAHDRKADQRSASLVSALSTSASGLRVL